LETLVAPEYEGIDPHGRSMTRGKFLTAFTSPKLKLRKLELSDLSVRNYGQVALVSGRSAVRGAFQNKPFNASAMFTDVWLRHGTGQWRLVASQVTPEQPNH
jgi:ketosteroid isomerase-like protein